jgi:hypothetical protein
MCLYRLPEMIAALARESAERPAEPPADVNDSTLPTVEEQLVGTAS